jgi:hypothetical protein
VRRRYIFLPQSIKDKSLREHHRANGNCQKGHQHGRRPCSKISILDQH